MSLDLFRLDGKVALVTGASRGLGAAMAVALAAAGADVALHASETRRPTATARRIAAATRPRARRLFTADLADRDGRRIAWSPTPSPPFGRLDILVNNAGIIRRAARRATQRRRLGRGASR